MYTDNKYFPKSNDIPFYVYIHLYVHDYVHRTATIWGLSFVSVQPCLVAPRFRWVWEAGV